MGESDEISFEQALKELEEAVARLETGGLTLDESIQVFTRARELAAYCEKRLEAAELRVQQLNESGGLEPVEP